MNTRLKLLLGALALALPMSAFAGGGDYLFGYKADPDAALRNRVLAAELPTNNAGGGTVVDADDEGPWTFYDETRLRRIMTELNEARVRDVYEAGVNTMIEDYQSALEGDTVRLWALDEGDFEADWQRDFMGMVRAHLNVAEGTEETSWEPWNLAMCALANYLNGRLPDEESGSESESD